MSVRRVNKRATIRLRQEFHSKYGHDPAKTKVNPDGSYVVSEWRQVKKHYNKTGEIL